MKITRSGNMTSPRPSGIITTTPPRPSPWRGGSNPSQDRRTFLTTLARGGFLAGLAVLGGALATRHRDTGDCSNRFSCGNCGLTDRCALPEAESYRASVLKSYKQGMKDGR